MNLHKATASMITSGFAVIEMPRSLSAQFQRVVNLSSSVCESDKKQFGFPLATDGFLPQGSEYAARGDRPDLCERFCFWPRNAAKHKSHALSQSSFYEAVSCYEHQINTLSQALLDALCDEFDAPRLRPIRQSSYLQLCSYEPHLGNLEREFCRNPMKTDICCPLSSPPARAWCWYGAGIWNRYVF
jgi:hypothetical protein